MTVKKKGYRVERKIRKIFEANGWKTIRSGASLGEADIICLKEGKCLLLQIKSSKKKNFYYYGFMKKKLEGFPFFIVVDFGYGRIRVVRPQRRISIDDGMDIKEFLNKFK